MKERAAHAHFSHIHDEVTISDVFPATIQGLEEDENLPEDTTAQDDQEDETEPPLSDALQTRRRISKILKTWGIHQIARWYECYVMVEPSAESSWQPPSTAVVLVRHRNVQLVQS